MVLDRNKLLKESVLYFKSKDVYEKLLEKVKSKYESLGHLGGRVIMHDLTIPEKLELGGFFTHDFSGSNTVSISARMLEKSLAESRFGTFTWKEIIEAYFGKPVETKKEAKERKESEKRSFFDEIIKSSAGDPGAAWLRDLIDDQGEGFNLIMRRYKDEPETLKSVLLNVIASIDALPVFDETRWEAGHVKAEPLAVFAARMTGDPHFFDNNTLAERLLTFFLRQRFPGGDEKTEYPAQERASLFFRAGILMNDLSNTALVYGLGGYMTDGRQHSGMNGFWTEREPLQLTLLSISRMASIYPQVGDEIYILENPAVFEAMAKRHPNRAVICGNGQVRLAVIALIDMIDSSVKLHYAGDFDPEGLVIAQRLRRRYYDRLTLWRYNTEYYEKYMCDEKISQKRLKILDKIAIPELQNIKAAMLKHGRAAYQETMMEELLVD